MNGTPLLIRRRTPPAETRRDDLGTRSNSPQTAQTEAAYVRAPRLSHSDWSAPMRVAADPRLWTT